MRFDRDTFNEIYETLARNKSRSFLTGFGVFWGLFMLLFLLGGGKGFKEMLAENFNGFATNTVVLFPNLTSVPYAGFEEGRYWNLTTNDVERIKTMIPQVKNVSPMISRSGESSYDGKYYRRSSLKAVSPDYRKIELPRMKYGRYLNENDLLQERKVCVIGKYVYEALFDEGVNPCGEYIKVGSVYFEIVGVNYASGAMNINGSSENSILIPFTVAQKIFNYGDNIEMICFNGKGSIKMTAYENRIRQVVAREHLFDPKDEEALFIFNTEEVFALIDNLFRGVDFLIWLIGIGTLLAGAIGVSNIMMITVKERTTELGIRRAIGATTSDILSQIILESVSLTLAAGMGGIVFTVLVLNVFDKVAHGSFQIGFWTAITAALLLTLLGVLAGLAPAYRAMAIKPVDAMRDE